MCPVDIKELSQGDVIRGGRLFFQINELQSLDRSDDGALRIVPARELDRVEQISLLPSVLCDLAVLSQTCDVRKREVPTVVLAPVFPLAIGGATTCAEPLDPSFHSHCRAYKLIHAYYLPPVVESGSDYPESYIDVRYASTLAKTVLDAFDVVRVLPFNHPEQFRVFLQNWFAREGLPDDITEALGKVTNEARDSRNSPHVYGFYIAWDDSSIRLLAVLHEHNEAVESRLKLAVTKANSSGSSHAIGLAISVKTDTTLAETEGYKRFAWDNLSFAVGTATDASGLSIPLIHDTE